MNYEITSIILSIIITLLFLPELTYRTGVYTNYAIGISAYACFIAISLYSVLTFIAFWVKKSYIQISKRTGFIMALLAVCVITLIQAVFSEILISSIAVVLVIISIYLCMENPTMKYLQFYHDEMVMGFATLVEGKDGSTGGHIRRSSAYAVLIANALRKTAKYKHEIT